MKQLLQLDQIDASAEEQESFFAQLAPYRQRLQEIRTQSVDDAPESSLILPDHDEIADSSLALADRYRGTTLVFLVGIGGSNLGALAVYQTLFGTQANLLRTPKLIPVDTIDGVLIAQAVALLTAALRAKEQVLLIVASKSGSTTETVANAELLIDALTTEGGSTKDSVLVITDRGSALWKLAQEHGMELVSSPKHVGGRYSVFSNVGLCPLAILGAPITELATGGIAGLNRGLSDDYAENSAAQHAIAIVASFRAGKPIHDLFCFSPSLELYGKWFRQLTGESIGKSATVGIVPSVSIGSTDLHSVVQLYLSGPDTTFTTFVRVQENATAILPSTSVFASLVPNLASNKLQVVADAILDGTRQAYGNAGRTYCTLTLPSLDAVSIGELLQQNMLTMMYLAELLHVNAFDQPAVELYKAETRRLLQKP